jgi:hypothetical protein
MKLDEKGDGYGSDGRPYIELGYVWLDMYELFVRDRGSPILDC